MSDDAPKRIGAIGGKAMLLAAMAASMSRVAQPLSKGRSELGYDRDPPSPEPAGAGGRAARQRAKTLAKKAARKGCAQ